MTGTLTLDSFAKINRSLLVRGKRPDGFHELDTLFSTIDLSDRLTFKKAGTTTLTCSDPALPVGPENLVVKAVRKLQELWGFAGGLEIHLEKRIPWGAGLGGGSSNAAVTLLASARIFSPSVSRESLHPVALELGSDVPFFLLGGSARGQGRGERLRPVASGPDEPLVLLIPPFRLSTPEVFRTLGAGPIQGTPGPTDLPDQNDLEVPAGKLKPEIHRYLRSLLDSKARQARMSGSGSCLFGIYGSPSEADEAARGLSELHPECRFAVTRTVGRTEYEARAVP